MSQTFNLKVPDVDCLRFTEDMDLSELIGFVGDHAVVCGNSDGIVVAYSGPFEEGDMILLEEDDMLVLLAGELEVFTAEAFDAHFEPTWSTTVENECAG